MSWSKLYQGSPADCLAAASHDQSTIEAGLPAFEQPDVGTAIAAAETLLAGVPEDAQVSLNLSGHGWRNANGPKGETAGAGNISVSVGYTMAALP